MALTLGNWSVIILLAIVGLAITVICFTEEISYGIISLLVSLIVCVGLIFGFSWYHKNTANGMRSYKDFESNMQNGLNREITIYAEDGREIFHYEGKVDVETYHDGNSNYILFDSEEGQRYIIYYGITDTMLIVEKKNN